MGRSNPRWISSALSSSIQRRSSGSASRAASQSSASRGSLAAQATANHPGVTVWSPPCRRQLGGRERLPVRVEHGGHPPLSGMPAAASSVSVMLVQLTSATAIPAVVITLTRPASAVPVSCSVPPPVLMKTATAVAMRPG